MKNFLLFTVSNRSFACAFEDILRIEPAAGGGAAEITPVPGFPDYIPGTAEIDGEITPIIDAAKRFGLGEAGDRTRACYIVADIGSESGELGDQDKDKDERYMKCALLADAINGSVQCADEDLLPPPEINADSCVKYVTGTLEVNGATCFVISPNKTIGEKRN